MKCYAYEGPVNRDGRRDCLDFRTHTMARSKAEAVRNIVWQYKIKFGLEKNADVELDGILYTVDTPPNIAKPGPKKSKVEYDYVQLQMNI